MPSFPGEKKTLLRYHEALCPNNISIINISLYYRRFHHSQIFWRAHKKRDVDYIFPICCLSRHSCTSQTTAIEINEKAFRIVKMSVSRGNIFSMQVVYLLKAPAEQLPLRLMRMLTDQLAFSKCYEVLYNTVVSVAGHLDTRSLNKQLQRQDKLHREIRWRKRFFIVRFASLNGANNISQQRFTSLHFPFITCSFE